MIERFTFPETSSSLINSAQKSEDITKETKNDHLEIWKDSNAENEPAETLIGPNYPTFVQTEDQIIESQR